MAGLFGFAGLSQVKLQGFEAEKTTELADKVHKYVVEKIDTAKRGTIYCRDMTPLATDANSFVLTINFAKIPRVPGFGIALSEATGIPAIEFADKDKGTRSWPTELTPEQRKRVLAIAGLLVVIADVGEPFRPARGILQVHDPAPRDQKQMVNALLHQELHNVVG